MQCLGTALMSDGVRLLLMHSPFTRRLVTVSYLQSIAVDR